MTTLHCGIFDCDNEAEIVWRGYSLCDACYELCDNIPEHVPSRYIEGIIMEMRDETMTGDTSVAGALARRGFTVRQPLVKQEE